MAVKTVRDILMADATVTSLVADRISPLVMSQEITYPAITLERFDLQPSNALGGDAALDKNIVEVDTFAETYALAREIADAVRAALAAAAVQLVREQDHFESTPLPGAYRIEQQFLVFTSGAGV